MRNRFLGLSAATAAAVFAAWFAPMPAAGQGGGKGKAAAYKAPRTADGTPDLQGIWEAHNTAAYNVEAHNAATGIRAGKSFVADPADGMIPYTAPGRKKQQENFSRRGELDSVNACFMTGVPRFAYNHFPFQVFQTPKYIVMISEYVHMVRYIHMDRKDHLPGIDFWNGDSLGHWEGDTLVVDVADNNNETWFDASGNHHSDQLKVVERFTRTGPDTLMYEATMTDPGTFTRPWTIRMNLQRDTDPYAQLLEYECHSYVEDDGRFPGR